MDKCPVCNNALRLAGVTETIQLNPDDISMAVTRREIKQICVNPECVNYAGYPQNPGRKLQFQYMQHGEAVVEYDMQPNIDFNSPRVIVNTIVQTTELPLSQDNVKAFAEKIVMEYDPEDAMALAAKLSEKAVNAIVP